MKLMLALCMVVGMVGCGGQDVGKQQEGYTVGNPQPPYQPPIHPLPSPVKFVDCPNPTFDQNFNNFAYTWFLYDSGSTNAGTDIVLITELTDNQTAHNNNITQIIAQKFDWRSSNLWTTNCYDITPAIWYELGPNETATTMLLHNVGEYVDSKTGQTYLRIDVAYGQYGYQWTSITYNGIQWTGGFNLWSYYP